MIVSEWQASVRAGTCNLIPLVTPCSIGFVRLPAYFINGDPGSPSQLPREARNVIRRIRERWGLWQSRVSCLSKGVEVGLQPIVAIQTTAPLLPDLKTFSEAREPDFGVNHL